ncbi:PERM Myeloperoxidase, partial [Acromyrmex charruanus]
ISLDFYHVSSYAFAIRFPSISLFVHSEITTFISLFRRANKIQLVNATCRVRSERPCPPSKYRTPSGACNNVRHPAWGARGSPFLKLLPSEYSDGKKMHNISLISLAYCFA